MTTSRTLRSWLAAGPITRGTVGTSLVLGTRVVLQAATLVILSRTLGPQGFGTYAALGGLAVLMGTLATAGTHLTLLRDVSRNVARNGSSLEAALGTTALCGGVLLGLYLLLSRTAMRS